MDEARKTKYSVRSISRVCDILDAVRTNPAGVSLAELVTKTGTPKSSVFRYLSVLEQRGYVRRDPHVGDFRPGINLLSSEAAILERLKHVSLPVLRELRDASSYTTNLGAMQNGKVIHLLVVESREPMRLTATVGEPSPIHSTALGKVMAATMDELTVRTILKDHGMPEFTPRTITTPSRYEAALDRCREAGFAVDDSENQLGGRCVAVLIPNLPVLAGVSASAPATQMPESAIQDIVEALRGAANSISERVNATAQSHVRTAGDGAG